MPFARQSQTIFTSLSRSLVGANGPANAWYDNLKCLLALLATATATDYTGGDAEGE
jgi:hypothetical protein